MPIYVATEYIKLILGLLDSQETALVKYIGYPYDCYAVMSDDISVDMITDDPGIKTYSLNKETFNKQLVFIGAVDAANQHKSMLSGVRHIKILLDVSLAEAKRLYDENIILKDGVFMQV